MEEFNDIWVLPGFCEVHVSGAVGGLVDALVQDLHSYLVDVADKLHLCKCAIGKDR